MTVNVRLPSANTRSKSSLSPITNVTLPTPTSSDHRRCPVVTTPVTLEHSILRRLGQIIVSYPLLRRAQVGAEHGIALHLTCRLEFEFRLRQPTQINQSMLWEFKSPLTNLNFCTSLPHHVLCVSDEITVAV